MLAEYNKELCNVWKMPVYYGTWTRTRPLLIHLLAYLQAAVLQAQTQTQIQSQSQSQS